MLRFARTWFNRRGSVRPNALRRRPQLEALEDRLVPASFVVSNLNSYGAGSLADAITQANATPGANLITFAPGLSGTLTAASGQTLTVTGNLDIEGPGASQLTVLGGTTYGEEGYPLPLPAFNVAQGAVVTISSLNLRTNVGSVYTAADVVGNAGTLTLNQDVITGNQNSLSPLGIYNSGTLTMNACVVDSNARGGISNSGQLTVSQCSITGNGFNGVGTTSPGINNTATGTATITDSLVSGNRAGLVNAGTLTTQGTIVSANGLGISNTGACTVDTSVVAGNSSGGIDSSSSAAQLVVTRSTVNGNTSFERAAGISIEGGTATLSNSTITGNQAMASNVPNHAGGVGNYGGTLTLLNCTIDDNTGAASDAGGIDTLPASGTQATTTLKNTLVAGNTGGNGSDLAGAFTSQGHNLIGNITSTVSATQATGFTAGVNGDQVGTVSAPIDPLLGPLQDNGGPTPTQALSTGSPAIDAGDNNGVSATDQRGFARVAGKAVDIGAYEVASNHASYRMDANGILYRYLPQTGWTSMNVSGLSFQVGTNAQGQDEIWLRFWDNSLYHFDGTAWSFTGGYVSALAAGRAEVFVLDAGGLVYRFQDQGGWSFTGASGRTLAVGQDASGQDEAWLLTWDQGLWRFDAGAWFFTGQALQSLTVGKGEVYGLDAIGLVWRFQDQTGWMNTGASGKAISLGTDANGQDELWLQAADNSLWRYDNASWSFTGNQLRALAAGHGEVFGLSDIGIVEQYQDGAGLSSTGAAGKAINVESGVANEDVVWLQAFDNSVWRYDNGQWSFTRQF